MAHASKAPSSGPLSQFVITGGVFTAEIAELLKGCVHRPLAKPFEVGKL